MRIGVNPNLSLFLFGHDVFDRLTGADHGQNEFVGIDMSVDYRGGVFTQSGFDRIVEFVLGVHRIAVDKVSVSELYEVGTAVERGFGISAAVEKRLPLPNHSERAVVHDDDDDGNVVVL